MSLDAHPQVSLVAPAPGALRLVQQFVNSRDIEDDRDELADPGAYRRWLASIASDAQGVDASPAALERARRLRESLRAALAANHDGRPFPAETAIALTDAAREIGLEPVFTPSGLSLFSTARGLDALLAGVMAAVAASIADDTWRRLKTCRNDGCQWAFYDRSRSRSAQWCSMKICGNRAKQSTWRAQHA